ncbi:hypothetical protein BDZ89DRAFT_1139019 [Hymenopellis radicata]|nr:hypothetical protein BDZ89DRAFT_1139019 [Hymenopellis radicata]
MCVITKKAAMESAHAIWSYDPENKDNRILDGKLDIIAILHTFIVKCYASRQRIQYFESCQLQSELKPVLKMVLHGNIRWSPAHGMMDRAYKLKKASTADLRFGPMTVIRNEKCQIIKKIPWHACRFEVEDWKQVRDARTILKIANNVQQLFSSELYPDLAKAIPIFEEVMTK